MKIPSLKKRLILIFVMVVLLLSSISFAIIKKFTVQFKSDISLRNLTLSTAVAGHIETIFKQPLNDFERLKKRLDDSEISGDDLKSFLGSNHLIELVEILSSKGQVQQVSPNNEEFIGLDLSNKSYFLKTLESKDLFWSNSFISTLTKNPSVTISKRFNKGVLVAQLDLNQLSEVIKILTRNFVGSITVVDRRGIIIAHTSKHKALERINISNMRAVQMGIDSKKGSTDDYWGEEKGLSSVTPIKSSGWSVIVFQPHTDALGIVDNIEKIFLITLFSVTGISLLLLLFVSNRLKHTLHQFEDQAFRLSEGNYNIKIACEYTEFKSISDNFHGMAKKILARENALKESEAKYRLMIETANEGICIVDQNGIYRFVNSKLAEILAGSVEDITGKHYQEFVFPEDIPFFQGKIAQRKSGMKEEYEARFRRKDKVGIWVIYSGAPIFDSNDNYIGSLGMIIDISDRKRNETELSRYRDHLEELVLERTIELEEAKRMAENANRTKSEFLANMSHEIRTPLNAVTGFSELLTSLVKDEKQRSYLEAIKSSGNNLLVLINDILDLSKIEAGKLEIQYSDVDLRVLIKEITHVFTLQASKKKTLLTLEIDDTLPPILKIDEIRLRQVLLNIIGNAIKFTEEGSIKVSVEALQTEQGTYDINILVEDTGIGISKDDIDTIFDSFRQQTDQDSSIYGGTGLGLTISKRLVEMMNGEILVRSKDGKGSIFEIVIKSVKAVKRDIPIIEERSDNKFTRFEKGKILVVDDVESNRTFLKELLGRVNLEVLEAKNGQEAVVIGPEYQPDVILMDIRMPVMDGMEATKILKGDKKTADIPVIAVTAFSSKMKESEIMKNNFDGFLSKPIEIGKLFSCLSIYLKNNQKEKKSSTDFTSLSAEAKSNLPELLAVLESDMWNRWKLFKSKQPMEDVKSFGEKLKELGIKYGVESLTEYGEVLIIHVGNFDIDNMKKAIDKYPDLIIFLKQFRENQ